MTLFSAWAEVISGPLLNVHLPFIFYGFFLFYFVFEYKFIRNYPIKLINMESIFKI